MALYHWVFSKSANPVLLLISFCMQSSHKMHAPYLDSANTVKENQQSFHSLFATLSRVPAAKQQIPSSSRGEFGYENQL